MKILATKRLGMPRSTKAKPLLWLVIVLLFLLAGFGGYFGTAPSRQERYLQHAPLSRLQELIQHDSDNPRVAYYLSKRLQQVGQTGPAATALEHAASLSESEDIYLAWASVVPEAQANLILRSYLVRHPNSASAHLALARLFQQQNDLSHCYEEAYLAAHLEAGHASAWQLLGESALRTSRYPEAEAAFKKAIALEPNTLRSYIGLGSALMLLNRRPEGMTVLNEAAALAPQDGSVLAALGSVILQGAESPADLRVAREYLERGLHLRPDLSITHLDLGECFLKENHPEEALSELMKARMALPDKPEVYFQLAHVYRALGDTEDARQALSRYVDLQNYFAERTSLLLRAGENDDPEMPLKLARLAVRHQAYQTALSEYKRAVDRSPGDPGIQREMAAVQAHGIK